MKYLLFFFACLLPSFAISQSANVPLNSDYSHLIDRYEILRGKMPSSHHSTFKAYKRSAIANFADSLLLDSTFSSKSDKFNLAYLANDNWEWTKNHTAKSKKRFLKRFYHYKNDFFNVRNPNFNLHVDKGVDNFDLHVNPVLYFSAGKETGSDATLMHNGRGVELRGTISDRIGFYTSIVENQIVAPAYVREKTDSLSPLPETPVIFGEAFGKQYNKMGYDYLTARGYLSFKINKMIDFQFGNDRHFVGNGYRSLMLSDFSAPQLFLKINTKFWKINYTNLYTQLVSEVQRANQAYPKKYMTMHHLSINLTKNINIGLWESVVFGRSDGYSNDTYVLGYLNPIIFYRSVEQNYGSADNALMGMDFKINTLKTMQIYGQVVLDEFVLSEVRNGNGWVNNKQALQLGLKYINAFKIKNLDLQFEYNYVRPHTYQHSVTPVHANYAHYNQALAHPLGANFREYVAILRYQPIPKLTFTLKSFYMNYGTDVNGGNWGGNIMTDLNKGTREYGNVTAQGASTKTLLVDFVSSYQIKHNVFIDFRFAMRRQDSENDKFDRNTNLATLAFRMNISQKLFEF